MKYIYDAEWNLWAVADEVDKQYKIRKPRSMQAPLPKNVRHEYVLINVEMMQNMEKRWITCMAPYGKKWLPIRM